MDTLRRPFLLAAIGLLALAVLLEIGATGVLSEGKGNFAAISAMTLPGEVRDALGEMDEDEQQQLGTMGEDRPPGIGILYMAFLDGVVLFTVGLMGVALLVPERVQGRVQGCATLIFGLLLLLATIVAIFAAIALLMLMLSLLLSVPFGTIAYLALFGFFDRGGAAVALSFIMALKVGAAVLLVLAQQRFLQNRPLIVLLLVSLLANIIISFLHGFVPGFLVSIADAIAAIIVAVLAVIWTILLLLGSLGAIIATIRPKV